MKALFWLLALCAAAVAVVILGRVESGYVLFIYPPYRVEVSMLFFALAAAACFFAAYAGLRLLAHTLGLPAYVRAWRARRRRDRAHAALGAALQAYYEGRYARDPSWDHPSAFSVPVSTSWLLWMNSPRKLAER